jgi:predicted transcriptional regulator
MKKLISIRLSDRDRALLVALAEKLQMSQADVISRALEKYAERKG